MKNDLRDSPLFKNLKESKLHEFETIDDNRSEQYTFDIVDYADPNRPKTCLEVDFPILKVNEISAIESNATKPIYMMSKWWARRRSSVFRQLLLAAAIKSPDQTSKASQSSWALMYGKNHQNHKKFENIKVVDIFMGGGTTVVEAARLGFNVTGIDINPIAWWVVNNEINTVQTKEIEQLNSTIEKIVKPQIMPYFCSQSPRANKQGWYYKETEKKVNIDIFEIEYEKRSQYEWRGAEIIYTFWMKHIMCSDPECFHLTPQITSSVVAEKKLSIKYWSDCVCPNCGEVFDLEDGNFQMAPGAKLIIDEDEKPFAPIEKSNGEAICPHCNKTLKKDFIESIKDRKGSGKSKKVLHFLALPKKWLKGNCAKSKDYYGGFFGSSIESDQRWFKDRAKDLYILEFRGNIPDKYKHTNFKGKKIICGGCGLLQDPLTSIKTTGHLAPIFPHLIQGFDPVDKKNKQPYNGRFYDIPDYNQFLKCFKEFRNRNDLHEYIPKVELFYGFQTHLLQGGVPNHGYTHWYKMFNPRQLYVHGLLLKTLTEISNFSESSKSQFLGGFQNYLRQNCMFTFWNRKYDKTAAHLSNNNYHPKAVCVETGVFNEVGAGSFRSCTKNVLKGLEFALNPYDLTICSKKGNIKSEKRFSNDKVVSNNIKLLCQSSTNLKKDILDESIDLIITDPPFGDNLNYSELADFFLVWLSKPLSKLFPDIFGSDESPKALEAVANKARHPGITDDGQRNCDVMYDRLMTMAWKEAWRILKPGGMMAFTFHHDKDDAWVNLLDSLFKGGFIIESTFPVRADSTQGTGEFGAKKIEFDIVHVCRKRLEEVKPIFWATLRRKIEESVRSNANLLAQHKISGLHLADLEVIIRGEVLEKYSRHYGMVKKNLAGDLMDVKEILQEANSIASSLLKKKDELKIPDIISAEGQVFLYLFRESKTIEHSDAKKRLKGAGVTLEDFEANGWLEIRRIDGKRIAQVISPVDRWQSLSRKKNLRTDIDQAHFLINTCTQDRTLKNKPVDLENWLIENYKEILPSTRTLLGFISKSHFGDGLKDSLGPAMRIFDRTMHKLREKDSELNAMIA